MLTNLIPLLINSGLAMSTAKLLAILVEGFIIDQRAGRVEADFLSAAARIVGGINRGHPDWSSELRSRFAADALLQYALICGILPQEKADVIVSMTQTGEGEVG